MIPIIIQVLVTQVRKVLDLRLPPAFFTSARPTLHRKWACFASLLTILLLSYHYIISSLLALLTQSNRFAGSQLMLGVCFKNECTRAPDPILASNVSTTSLSRDKLHISDWVYISRKIEKTIQNAKEKKNQLMLFLTEHFSVNKYSNVFLFAKLQTQIFVSRTFC